MNSSQFQAPWILGWDVGGAHLKAAVISPEGTVVGAAQVACPLWRGLERLSEAFEAILPCLNVDPLTLRSFRHAVTMTGELVDCFASRADGVSKIASAMRELCQGELSFFQFPATKLAEIEVETWVQCDSIEQHWARVASANWFASLSYLAKKKSHALVLDIGSSTCDIMLIQNGYPCCSGQTDAERMQSHELVYTGVVRTPVMALSHQLPFRGKTVQLAAEHFATSADVYRLTKELNPRDDMSETADGADKSERSSARRLARMVGRDVDEGSMEEWRQLAFAIRDTQINRIKQSALHALSRAYTQNVPQTSANPTEPLPIIGLGAGAFLAEAVAMQLGRPFSFAKSLIHASDQVTQEMAQLCFPAYAVGMLAWHSTMANP